MSFPAKLDIRLSAQSHYYCFYCNLDHFSPATFQLTAVWTHMLMLWPQAHFVLFGIQIGVTEDRVVDMDYSYLLASECLQACLDNLVEEVHILQPPALDGNIKATHSDKISLINTSNAKPIVSPEASFLSKGKMVVTGNFPAINNLWIILVKDEWEIYLLAQNCICSTPLQEFGSKHQVNVTEEEQRFIIELGRSYFKARSS